MPKNQTDIKLQWKCETTDNNIEEMDFFGFYCGVGKLL